MTQARNVKISRTSRPMAALGRGAGWVWASLLAILIAAPANAAEGLITVPSGREVALSEVLVDKVGAQSWVRFRFLAPSISRAAGDLPFEVVSADLEALCTVIALPYLTKWDLTADKVVLSLSDRVVPFGQTDPDATQFFEAYRIEADSCIWEEF